MNFIESSHKYSDGEGEYVPVTTFLKSFQEKVNWNEVAEKKAKKMNDGTTKEQLLEQWKDKRDRAAERGTQYHKMKEEELLQTGVAVVGYGTIDGIKEDPTMLLVDNTTYVEKMIWSKRFGVCGTADLVEVVDGRINVKDYKTNEKLDFESWRNPRTRQTKRLISPVQHLDDCNFNLYQLQVNVYMYMLLQQNRHLKMGKMEILHVVFNEDRTVKETLIYPCLNMQREAKNMLETHHKNKSQGS